MKHLVDFLNESLDEGKECPNCHHNPCICNECGYTEEEMAACKDCKECNFTEEEMGAAEETIKNEEDFRAACKAKFEKAFGDKLDDKKMNKTIDGMLADHKEEVEKGEWGKLMGMMNKAFGA